MSNPTPSGQSPLPPPPPPPPASATATESATANPASPPSSSYMVTRLRSRRRSLASDTTSNSGNQSDAKDHKDQKDQKDNKDSNSLSRSARIREIKNRVMNRARIPAMADSSPPPASPPAGKVDTVTIRFIHDMLTENWEVPLRDMNEVIVSKFWRGNNKEPRDVHWRSNPPKFEDISRDQMAAILTHVAARDEKHPCVECAGAEGGVFKECRVKASAWNKNGRCTSCIYRDEASHNNCSFARARMGENVAMSTTGVSDSYATVAPLASLPPPPPPPPPPPSSLPQQQPSPSSLSSSTAPTSAATAVALLREAQQKRKRASLAETPTNSTQETPAEQPQPEKRRRGRPKRNSMPATAGNTMNGRTAATSSNSATTNATNTTGVTTRRRSGRIPKFTNGQDRAASVDMLSVSTRRWLNDTSTNEPSSAEQASTPATTATATTTTDTTTTETPPTTTTTATTTSTDLEAATAAATAKPNEVLTQTEKERMSQLAKQLENSSMINMGWIQRTVREDGDKAKAEIQTVREYLELAEKLAGETGRIRRQVEALEAEMRKLTQF